MNCQISTTSHALLQLFASVKARGLAILLAFVITTQPAPGGAQEGASVNSRKIAGTTPAVRVSESDPMCQFEFVFPPLQADRVAHAGTRKWLFRASWATPVQGREGKAVPVFSDLVALPHSQRVQLRVISTTWDTLQIRWRDLASLEEVFRSPDSSTTLGSAFKDLADNKLVSLENAGKLLGCPVARLLVSLLRPAADGEVLELRRLKFSLVAEGARPLPRSGAPEIQRRLTGIVLNPSWVNPQPPRDLPIPQGQPGKIRISTVAVDSGMVRVTGEELARLGVDLPLPDRARLTLLYKGKPLPFLLMRGENQQFDRSDTLLFYASALHGDTCFVHPFADTNVFWLDWDANASPNTYRPLDVPLSLTAPVDSVVPYRIHLERELVYHDGDDDLAIKISDQVPGEGWVWKRFNPGDELEISFDVRDLWRDGSASVHLRVRGITLSPPVSQLRVRLNGEDIGNSTFENRRDQTIAFNVPANLLREGSNTLRVSSEAPSGAEINQWYLDWVEVTYPRSLVWRAGEVLDVWLPKSGTPKTWSVRIAGRDKPTALYVEQGIRLTGLRMDRSHQDSLVVLSAGHDDGNMCRIWVRGKLVVNGGSRGHNLVALDSRTGEILAVASYDTYRDTAQANAMAEFIASLPESSVVLVGIRDEGSASMTEAAYRALETLGSVQCRAVAFRDSWAMVGRKGAEPGSAIEKLVRRGQGQALSRTRLRFPDGGALRCQWTDPTAVAHHLVLFHPRDAAAPARVELDVPGHLTDQRTEGAEYVIVTHQKFLDQAEELASHHRARDGLSVLVVDVKDIYDEFNFGIKSPDAIRDFITYAFWQWPSPQLRYVLLFGDASWDPHLQSDGAVNYDLVPSYGKPVSDSRFVCVDGPGDRLPDLAVGRLPAQQGSEAKQVIEKILEYDRQTPARWMKRFLLVTGGFDHFEQNLFISQTTDLAREYLDPPPASMSWTMVNKQTEGYVEGEGREQILRGINRGVLWVNFIGHAGSRTWDLMFHNPDVDDLENAPFYPFISSMTCHTARFANPYQQSFGERFVLAPRKGSIGFLGTTGWGYVYRDEFLLRQLLSVVFRDTVQILGEALWRAKLGYWANAIGNAIDQTILDQYVLLGDPALDLALPEQPDLAIGSGDIRTLPPQPSSADTVARVQATVWNYGLALMDTVHVVFSVHSPEGVESELARIPLAGLGLRDSLECLWNTLGREGEYLLTVAVNPDGAAEEVGLDNNTATRAVRILGRAPRILWPSDFSALPASEPVLLYIEPGVLDTSGTTFTIELDSSASFATPLARWSVGLRSKEPVLTVPLGKLDPGHYYVRVRSDQQGELRAESLREFRITEDVTGTGWMQMGRDLLANPASGVRFTKDGVKLGKTAVPIRVESAGHDDGNYARILLNGKPFMETRRGHNVAVIDPFGRVSTASFDTYQSQAEADSLAAFLSAVPEGYYVAIAIRDEGTASMNDKAFQVLESLGSRHCRSVGFRDSWAFFVRAGFPESAREAWSQRGQGVAVIADSVRVYSQRGQIASAWIGPASSWRELRVPVAGARGQIELSVLGKMSQAFPDTVLLHAQLLAGAGEHSIPLTSFRTRYVRLVASFSPPDTSIELRGWKLSFDPPAELVIRRLSCTPQMAPQGSNFSFQLVASNLGPDSTQKTRVIWRWRDIGGEWKHGGEFVLPRLAPGDSASLSWTWRPALEPGTYPVSVALDADDLIAELSEANNLATVSLQLIADSTAPRIAFYTDGKQIVDGDYVPSQATIEVVISDATQYLVKDSSLVRVAVDGQDVRRLGDVEVMPGHAGRFKLRFAVELEPGSHLIEASARDLAGNHSEAWVYVKVSSELAIERVMNYPNPFADETTFTYFLTVPADRVVIRVFTLAGRQVWYTDQAPAEAGFNQFQWDGHDADGAALANGVYLYTVEARAGPKKARVLSKLVVMR